MTSSFDTAARRTHSRDVFCSAEIPSFPASGKKWFGEAWGVGLVLLCGCVAKLSRMKVIVLFLGMLRFRHRGTNILEAAYKLSRTPAIKELSMCSGLMTARNPVLTLIKGCPKESYLKCALGHNMR